MTTEMKHHDLTFTRVFNAPVEQVWKAWTESEMVMAWWGPDGFSSPLARMDVREGGTSLLCMSSPQFGDHYSIWQYHKIVPNERLEFIHNLADKDGNKVDPVAMGMPSDFPQDQKQVVIFKALADNQTELTVIEYGWTEGQMMEMSRMGMNQCLDKMESLLTRKAA